MSSRQSHICHIRLWKAALAASKWSKILKYIMTYIFVCKIGEYKTEVRQEDVSERPIVGQSKRLTCYNSEENTGNPVVIRNEVRWIHNGHTVQNDDRHAGASTRVLNRYSHFTRKHMYAKCFSLFSVCLSTGEGGP